MAGEAAAYAIGLVMAAKQQMIFGVSMVLWVLSDSLKFTDV